jgi:hypothetical protein
MNIVEALRQEEIQLKKQLAAVHGAIIVLNGGTEPAASIGHASSPNGSSGKRKLSAAGRAAISRAAKARWAKIKAAKVKKGK